MMSSGHKSPCLLSGKPFSFLLVSCVVLTLISYQNVNIRTLFLMRKETDMLPGTKGVVKDVETKAETGEAQTVPSFTTKAETREAQTVPSFTTKAESGEAQTVQSFTTIKPHPKNKVVLGLNKTIPITNNRTSRTSKDETVTVTKSNSSNRSVCPEGPLVGGPFRYNMTPAVMEDIANRYPNTSEGGHWTPEPLCRPRYNVAIIVPYRDRPSHIPIFLNNMHKFLQLQFLEYTIYIVEQAPGVLFNRALLMNVGYLEARRVRHYDCYIFHDVDMIPMDTRNVYNCSSNPRHLAVARDKQGFSMPYRSFFGGGTILKPEHLDAMNGFTNIMFGWGAEDDEAFLRVTSNRLKVERYPNMYGRYKSIPHDLSESGNPKSGRSFGDVHWVHKVYKSDGINSIKYKIKSLDKERLFTRILVEIDGPKTTKEVKGFLEEKMKMFLKEKN